jgi:hypothetical protein
MSASRILYKSDFYEITADSVSEIIRTNWLRPVTKEEMIEGGTKLHDLLLETQFKKVLANGQKLKWLDVETKEWMSTKFYELLSETPLEKIARVLPSNLFFQLALESVATRADALGIVKFQFKNFQHDAPALRWLKG